MRHIKRPGDRRPDSPDPTPEEMALLTAEIREEWTPEVERKRRTLQLGGSLDRPLEIPRTSFCPDEDHHA